MNLLGIDNMKGVKVSTAFIAINHFDASSPRGFINSLFSREASEAKRVLTAQQTISLATPHEGVG